MRPRLRKEGFDNLTLKGRLDWLHLTVLVTYSVEVIFTPN